MIAYEAKKRLQMQENLRERIIKQFAETRERTLQLFELADEAVLHESPGFGFRPILWHLAHIGAFEEYWILQKINGDQMLSEIYHRIFDPIKTPRESSKNLPSKAEMLDYLDKVRHRVWRVSQAVSFDERNPLLRDGYVFDLVHQHELQHQETLVYLFHLLPISKLQISNFKSEISKTKDQNPRNDSRFTIHDSLEIPAGNFIVGARENGFVYDNEIPAHEQFIPAFRLDCFLTTNAEIAEFIAEKGYERKEFWSEEGWQFREKENWNTPLYWKKQGSDWQIRAMFEEKCLSDAANYPVYGVSFYESEAYANFRGKRLPTEFEWEKAASLEKFEPEKCNFGFRFGQTTPLDYFGKENFSDLRGNLWEWTASDFAGYPNFKPFPYEDYSQAWFDGDHKVLKGGSFATSKEMLRTTFRNFFRRHFRVAFAGIRLASDV